MNKIIVCIALVLMLVGCQKQNLYDKDELNIVVASDLHYFAKEYYQDCEWFEESMLYGDGKMVTYSDEIIDNFINQVIEEKPDLVLLSGDLSFNGEINSHRTLATKLQKLKDNNIDVAVINGNHDVDNIYAKGYGKDDYFEVDNVSAKEFKEIYKNLGYDIAINEHKDSLSYELLLNHKYNLFVVDSCTHELTTGYALDVGGKLTESTMKWLEEGLKQTRNDNKVPLVMMHHNLAIHNDINYSGYTINNYDEVSTLMNNYNVPVVLSGHMHLQHIGNIKNITDIATSSLLDNPLQYGVIQLNNEQLTYQTKQVTIKEDPAQYFEEVCKNKYNPNHSNDQDIMDKQEVYAKATKYYFAGNINEYKDEIKSMKGYELLLKENGIYSEFLTSMMKEENNSNYIKIKINP
jgi:3',5'-cyclic AMP phosphodiesterase CpdA